MFPKELIIKDNFGIELRPCYSIKCKYFKYVTYNEGSFFREYSKLTCLKTGEVLEGKTSIAKRCPYNQSIWQRIKNFIKRKI